MFTDLNVASVDCTTDHGGELCKAFQIRSYPTLLYLPHGGTKYVQYRGPRALEDLEKFVDEEKWKELDALELPENESLKAMAGAFTTESIVDDLKESFLQ